MGRVQVGEEGEGEVEDEERRNNGEWARKESEYDIIIIING